VSSRKRISISGGPYQTLVLLLEQRHVQHFGPDSSINNKVVISPFTHQVQVVKSTPLPHLGLHHLQHMTWLAIVTMAGFVYACCPEGETSRVKIGFTTSNDPEKYCRTHHAGTLCPLVILRATGYANARLAEQGIHFVLAADRPMRSSIYPLIAKACQVHNA